jgi:phenylacetate-coenzyme A ligase PaaK-like adenylate-forming protein
MNIDVLTFALRAYRLAALPRYGARKIAAVQRERWRRLLHHAASHSPYYQSRLRGLDLDRCRPAEVPVLTKAEMMEHFDAIVTDRRIRLASVRQFLADPGNVGRLYLGQYAVCHTSGSEGRPAVVVQEGPNCLLPTLAQIARGHEHLGPFPWLVWHRLRHPGRLAVVTQRPGFYPSGSAFSYFQAAGIPFVKLLRLSVFGAVEETVAQLNGFRPEFLCGYTSALETLAREQIEGRLGLRRNQGGQLLGLTNISEPLPAESRAFIEEVFGVHISDQYALAECAALTSGCPRSSGSHVNADLALLEVVDDQYRPVPPGTPGTRVLVTNLTDLVQPIIRYDVGDVVIQSPQPCPCGSPLPLVHAVAGRTKERLWIATDGKVREVPYYLFLAALHHCAELAEHQVVQTGRNRFAVRVAPQPGKAVSPQHVRALVHQSLAAEGLAEALDVHVEVVRIIPRDPGSGKLKRAVQEWREAGEGQSAIKGREPGVRAAITTQLNRASAPDLCGEGK